MKPFLDSEPFLFTPIYFTFSYHQGEIDSILGLIVDERKNLSKSTSSKITAFIILKRILP